MPWMIALAAYFAVGFTLIFVGPAARARRREQTIWEWHPARRPWIQKTLSLSIALGTFAFWPVFTLWGKRELHGWIAAVQTCILTQCPMKPTGIRRTFADGFGIGLCDHRVR